MNKQLFGQSSGKAFHAYPKGDFDLESGNIKKARKPKNLLLDSIKMLKTIVNRIHYYSKIHPLLVLLISLSFGVAILIILSMYTSSFQMNVRRKSDASSSSYPYESLRNLVMVAGHSVYMSSSCGKVDGEESWFLEPYQKHPGQAATFLMHIKEGIQIAAKDERALLLFSGGETRKDAGPQSEAQSYWAVAESQGWFALARDSMEISMMHGYFKMGNILCRIVSDTSPFTCKIRVPALSMACHCRIRAVSGHHREILISGKQEDVRWRALTEEHARDSFENLLFSVCRFRELTGTYPHNVTVVSYDFKEERFAHLHRLAIGFPEARFFYFGTPASSTSKEAAMKGESAVRAQFHEDPYGCVGSLHRKKLTRDPFHRSIPYPNGCPELKGMFSYCGAVPYPGKLPWTQ